MKKKIVTVIMATTISLSLMACGGSKEAPSQKTVVETNSTETASETQNLPETQEPVTTEAPASEPETSDGSTTGEIVEEGGIRKIPVITDKELNREGESGPIKYNIEAVQVSKLTATTDEMAQLLGIEKDKEVAMVAFNVSAENTSEDTINFYIGMATLTTNTKEQVECDSFLADYIDGEFLGNVIRSGTLIYILPNSSADDITNLTLHIDAPSDENFEYVGDEAKIELNFE